MDFDGIADIRPKTRIIVEYCDAFLIMDLSFASSYVWLGEEKCDDA